MPKGVGYGGMNPGGGPGTASERYKPGHISSHKSGGSLSPHVGGKGQRVGKTRVPESDPGKCNIVSHKAGVKPSSRG